MGHQNSHQIFCSAKHGLIDSEPPVAAALDRARGLRTCQIRITGKAESAAAVRGSRTIRSPLKLACCFGGFLRALSESRKLRSNFGRVAQQPETAGKLATVREPRTAAVLVSERKYKQPGEKKPATWTGSFKNALPARAWIQALAERRTSQLRDRNQLPER